MKMKDEIFINATQNAKPPLDITYKNTNVDLKAEEPTCEGPLNLKQNVAYESSTILLSSNVAYESHLHQGTGGQLLQDDFDYDYI